VGRSTMTKGRSFDRGYKRRARAFHTAVPTPDCGDCEHAAKSWVIGCKRYVWWMNLNTHLGYYHGHQQDLQGSSALKNIDDFEND